MANVVLKNISKTFDKKNILDNINLEIKDGEFCVLLGESGSGKTTLLRIIAGLEKQNFGEIYIDDKNCTDTEPKNRDIAFVFQSYALYPHLSVYENIAFPLKIRKVDKKIIDEKVKEVVNLLDLSDEISKKPKELSGGQRQRVALGRAIIRSPKVFLMDEPLSNLDSKLRQNMRYEIKKLQQKLKATIIYVTHDQIEAQTMGDRVVLLNNGKIQQNDTPKNIYNNPNNVFVAKFIGNLPMNIIKFNEKYIGFRSENVDLIKKDDFNSFDFKDYLLNDDGLFFKVFSKYAEIQGNEKVVKFNLNESECQIKINSDLDENSFIFHIKKDKIYYFDENKNRV